LVVGSRSSIAGISRFTNTSRGLNAIPAGLFHDDFAGFPTKINLSGHSAPLELTRAVSFHLNALSIPSLVEVLPLFHRHRFDISDGLLSIIQQLVNVFLAGIFVAIRNLVFEVRYPRLLRDVIGWNECGDQSISVDQIP